MVCAEGGARKLSRDLVKQRAHDVVAIRDVTL